MAVAEKKEGKKERKISEKHIKLIVILAVIAVVLVIVVWGMVPEKIYEVSEVTKNKNLYDGKEISIKGVILAWNGTTKNFTLADAMNTNITISVTHSGAFPEGFGNNATVVVKGIFRSQLLHMDSIAIQIGCPSKY
jgi:cytochrome c-type biogenesis protein CcmE